MKQYATICRAFKAQDNYHYKMSVKVAVRVRPFNQRQIFLNSQCCVQMKDGKTRLVSSAHSQDSSRRQFTFDYSFWSHDSYKTLQNGLMVPVTDKYWGQQRVFNEVGIEIINNAWQGYNCCLFAYGQTGAGKSYSMIGFGANRGVVPMACEEIFNRICRNTEKNRLFEVTVSMVEIYNEKVQDLLVPDSRQRPSGGLEIRESKKLGVYVDGVTKHIVHNFKQIQKWMQQGSKNRSLAATLMNQYSSRAHTIISIQFIQRQQLSKNQVTQKSSTIHLIDLAGSQRVSKTGLANSDRLKQAGNINKSLHHLGLVIQILAQKSLGKRKNQIVPYRSSCLTRILQNSLGGNSKTIMICAVSPAYDNYEQSLSTLRYADQVKKIKNHATVNESLTDRLIRELREENQRLKNMIKDLNDKTTISPGEENLLEEAVEEQKEVQKKISTNRRAMQSFAIREEVEPFQDNLLANISDIDLDKLQESDHQISAIVYMDMFKNNEPYLTNLSEDQLLSGKLQYNIQQELVIGRKNGNPTPQVILGAMGIQPNHAKIYRRMDRIFISTYSQVSGDFTYVNGQNIYESTEIFHNDRIVFGTGCVFVLKTPEAIPRKPISDVELTYEMAISELQNLDKNKSTAEEEELMGKLKVIEQEIEDEKARMQSRIAEEQRRFNQEIARVKAQKEIQNRHLLQQLKRKQQQSCRLLKQHTELQQMKQASRKLQQQLQRQRLQKMQLQKCLEQSLYVQSSLREQRQREIKQMQRKQRERMEQIRMHQEMMERKEKERQEEQGNIEREKRQEEMERMREEARVKAEDDMQRHEQTLREKMVSCMNQNILNERFLELKKKKKEIEELRNLLIKKERAELQKKLVDMLPLIIELNLIAKQMKRQIEVSAKIDYQYFGYYQLTQILKHSTYKSRIRLRVMVQNLQQGRIYFWTIQTFKNRLYLAKDMLQKYIQDPKNPALSDKDNDPFWDPKQYQLIGQSYLTLQHLLFNLDYSNPSLKIIGDRTCKGQMSVRVFPTTPDGEQNLSKSQEKNNIIQNPRATFEKDLHYIIAIDAVRLDELEEVVEFYVEYEVLENNYRFVKYETNKVRSGVMQGVKEEMNYLRKHLFKEITEPTLLYIGGSQVCFKVYALRKSRPLVKQPSRIDSSSDIDNNSFMSLSKSQNITTTNSMSTPPRNPKNEIYENPDVLGQIEQAYDQKQRRDTKSSISQSMTSKNSNSGKSSKESPGSKKKDKDCSLF